MAGQSGIVRLATFTSEGTTRLGVVVEDQIVDLARAAPALPTDMIDFLGRGAPALCAARAASRAASFRLPLADVRLEAPLRRPGKFLGIGANYPAKAVPGSTSQEVECMRREGHQLWFNKQVTCINAPFAPIVLPRVVSEMTFEPELAVIIGMRCRYVTVRRAPEVIAGYTICNDVTAVDWIRRSPTATLAKSFDTHGPLGPWIVTAEDIDPSSLAVQGFLNGVLCQSGDTASMVFSCHQIVAYLSQVFTLEPGDILSTGSPAGTRPRLTSGDIVRCQIEGIGCIESTIVAEVPS
jgi:2-keto-4-pentenoate hydratase/2-oxohepta-3-ene-1,7-dioic acid hydratase in catechol pathway